MKIIEAVLLYKALKDLKLSSLNTKDRVTILLFARSVKSYAQKYESDINDAIERLKPEGYDELVDKTFMHNDSVARKVVSFGTENARVMTSDEILELRVKDREFNKALNAYKAAIENEEIEDIDIKCLNISSDGFNLLCKNNADLTVDDEILIYNYLVECR